MALVALVDATSWRLDSPSRFGTLRPKCLPGSTPVRIEATRGITDEIEVDDGGICRLISGFRNGRAVVSAANRSST